ncbi:hypothetical protein C8F04DRAFT_623832 [Mycena alexandri]|uniref:Uncharacterized protein n=1 Tax=Mycena alexandri TaxID=1745969 RepID=A0AAD6X2L5_9AGAR|nr:hypothetical protein C8F04DRAFT_623832 [Mycena alexandri]
MQTVCLDIQSYTQFKTYAVGDAPNGPDTQGFPGLRPQAQANTMFMIDFDPDTVSIERSHAVLGLLAHRPASIHLAGNTVQNTFAASLGVSGAVPALTGCYAHGRSTTHALEATDSKPVPSCQIDPVQGEHFRRDGKDYRSYNYTYTPRADLPGLRTNKRSVLKVGFGVGINFNPYMKDSERLVQPPQVTFINRNQVFIWVKNDQFGAEGITIFLTNEIPDIRRRSQIIKDNEAHIDFKTGLSQTSEFFVYVSRIEL